MSSGSETEGCSDDTGVREDGIAAAEEGEANAVLAAVDPMDIKLSDDTGAGFYSDSD